jgi:hypothetical protein
VCVRVVSVCVVLCNSKKNYAPKEEYGLTLITILWVLKQNSHTQRWVHSILSDKDRKEMKNIEISIKRL